MTSPKMDIQVTSKPETTVEKTEFKKESLYQGRKVTEEKKSEKSKVLSEENYKKLEEFIPGFILIKNENQLDMATKVLSGVSSNGYAIFFSFFDPTDNKIKSRYNFEFNGVKTIELYDYSKFEKLTDSERIELQSELEIKLERMKITQSLIVYTYEGLMFTRFLKES